MLLLVQVRPPFTLRLAASNCWFCSSACQHAKHTWQQELLSSELWLVRWRSDHISTTNELLVCDQTETTSYIKGLCVVVFAPEYDCCVQICLNEWYQGGKQTRLQFNHTKKNAGLKTPYKPTKNHFGPSKPDCRCESDIKEANSDLLSHINALQKTAV